MPLNGVLNDLIDRQTIGFTLEQAFYTDADIFRYDLGRVLLPQWLFVDHVSRIPEAGDWFVYELAGESIIIVRDGNGDIHAHFNVCRHRGSRICLEPEGNAKRLICPYHAWAYELDGSLAHARQMPDGFDKRAYALHSCRVRIFEGLIFINIADSGAADFDVLRANLDPFIAPHGLAHARIAHRETYPTDANWKLVVENFRECYHCSPSHPEYTAVNTYVRSNDRSYEPFHAMTEEWNVRVSALGHKVGIFDSSDAQEQAHGAQRQPIRDGFLTLTEDGTAAGPLMGDFREYDGGETFVYFGALSYGSLANDHATLFRFTPVRADHTEVVVTWLVDEDAKQGVDYDIEHLKWMWDVTSIQDTKIINDNQLGINSRRYSPGPYSDREGFTEKFTSWYLSRLALY